MIDLSDPIFHDEEKARIQGVGTTGYYGVDMDQQLLGHAQNIVNFANRGPLAHCWGDAEVDAIAAGSKPPSNLERWVQIGVNRHIELIRANLP